MSIEIIKEEFKIEEQKGKSEVQTLVETEIYLNTMKEDPGEIIWIEGRAELINTLIIKDKLLLNGLVKYNIVYKAKDEESSIYSIDTIKDFNEEIPIKGISEDMISSIDTNIEYIEYELGESKLEIKTLVNIFAQVSEIRKVTTIKDVVGRNDLEALKENIKYEEIHGREESYAEIRELLRIGEDKSSIDRVIKFSLDAKEIESTVVEDRLIISGEVLVNLIYVGDSEVYSIGEEIPFNHFLEVPGAFNDAKGEVKLDIVEATYDIMEDEREELRLVDIEVKIKVSGKVYEEGSRNLIVDAYSTREALILKKEEINIPENLEHLSYGEKLDFEAKINAMDILDIRGVHNIVDKKLTEDTIVIDGNLDMSIYYIDRIGGELASFKEAYPYKSTIPYNGESIDLSMDISSKLADIDYNLKRDGVQIETSIQHDILIRKDRKFQGIKAIEETGELIDKKSMPSITVYIAQKDDLLWDIAKRYNTTTDEILSTNALGEDYVLSKGDKIIIEKNLDIDF